MSFLKKSFLSVKADSKVDVSSTTDTASFQIVLDSRLPFANYRELFTMKNYWKTVKRNEQTCAMHMFHRFLTDRPEYRAQYSTLSNINWSEDVTQETVYINMALAYLTFFDDLINDVFANPRDCTQPIETLRKLGQTHKQKVQPCLTNPKHAFQSLEVPLLSMLSNVLEDRFNEKAERLFQSFFQFCAEHIIEGFET